jgi:hypothetical protein
MAHICPSLPQSSNLVHVSNCAVDKLKTSESKGFQHMKNDFIVEVSIREDNLSAPKLAMRHLISGMQWDEAKPGRYPPASLERMMEMQERAERRQALIDTVATQIAQALTEAFFR